MKMYNLIFKLIIKHGLFTDYNSSKISESLKEIDSQLTVDAFYQINLKEKLTDMYSASRKMNELRRFSTAATKFGNDLSQELKELNNE